MNPIQQQFIQKRQIPLVGMKINEGAQELATSAILYFNTLGVDPITLLIDSGGGESRFGEIIIDSIRMSKAPVHGTVVGYATSAAFWILQNCHKRIARPSSRMMFHGAALAGCRIDERGFATFLRETKSEHERILKFLSRRTRKSIATWRAWSREEKYFSGKEAFKYGIVDEVTPLPDLPGMS